MDLSLDATRWTVVADVHTVYVCSAVSSNVLDVFTVHPLGICFALPFHRHPRTPVVSCSCFLALPGQGGNGFGAVGNGLALRHNCLSICCSRFCQVDEGIVRPIHIFYVVHSVVFPRASRWFFSLILPLRCLEMRLEVCPGVFVTLLVVPLVAVFVKQACTIHERVNCVDNIFIGDCPPSVVRKRLDCQDPLH